MINNAFFESQREIKTFVDLFHGSDILLEKSKEVEKGSYFTTMASLLLTAFTFEAYLNHIGQEKILFWHEIENVSVFKKYRILCTEFSIPINPGERPYQTIQNLFKFRNSIAHGTSQLIKKEKPIPSSEDISKYTPKTMIEEFCTQENAIKAREDVEQMIVELNIQAGYGDYPFTSGMTLSSMTLMDEG